MTIRWGHGRSLFPSWCSDFTYPGTSIIRQSNPSRVGNSKGEAATVPLPVSSVPLSLSLGIEVPTRVPLLPRVPGYSKKLIKKLVTASGTVTTRYPGTPGYPGTAAVTYTCTAGVTVGRWRDAGPTDIIPLEVEWQSYQYGQVGQSTESTPLRCVNVCVVSLVTRTARLP
eukprot:1536208-Rhodomonas_salina.1